MLIIALLPLFVLCLLLVVRDCLLFLLCVDVVSIVVVAVVVAATVVRAVAIVAKTGWLVGWSLLLL